MASNLGYGSRHFPAGTNQPATAQRPQQPRGQYPRAQYEPQAARGQSPQPPRPQAGQQAQHPPGIDPGIMPLIRQSAARLSRNEEAFIQQLYHDVTGLTEDRAGSQAPNMRAFCERMVHLLFWVALTDQPLPVVLDALRQVGAQNWAEGFSDAQYGNFAHALVQTVHYLTDREWSASTGSVWISYLMWVRPHLLAGAQYAATQQAAAQQAAERQATAERAVAEQEAARVAALARETQVVADVNLESVASILDDEDDDDPGYGQIMLGMTRAPRRPQALVPAAIPAAPGDAERVLTHRQACPVSLSLLFCTRSCDRGGLGSVRRGVIGSPQSFGVCSSGSSPGAGTCLYSFSALCLPAAHDPRRAGQGATGSTLSANVRQRLRQRLAVSDNETALRRRIRDSCCDWQEFTFKPCTTYVVVGYGYVSVKGLRPPGKTPQGALCHRVRTHPQ
jgi:hypothetical protein